MKEIWKDIKNYEGLYKISNFGRVKSFIKFNEGKVLKNIKTVKNYLQIGLAKNNIKRMLIHRLVAQHFITNSKNKPCINHKDGNKQNNYVKNLEWVTFRENNEHCFVNGFNNNSIGENHFNSKLSDNDVIKIRYLRKQGLLLKTIANKFNVSIANIGYIVNNKWRIRSYG